MVHPHLSRQLDRLGLSTDAHPESLDTWRRVIECISAAYRDADQDRYLLERSLAISSSEMRELHAQLQAERDLLRTIVGSLSDALCAVDSDGRVIFLNTHALTLFGIGAAGVIGEQLSTLVDLRMEGGDPFTWQEAMGAGERRVIINGDTASSVHCCVSPLAEPRPGAVMVCRDLTEAKRIELQLAQSQKLESIGQLAAGIAHEINTPTQYLGDNARFVRDNLPTIFRLLERHAEALDTVALPEATRAELHDLFASSDIEFLKSEMPKAVEQSLDGVERISAIVRAMKDFSHPGSDEKEPVDLNQAIRSTTIVCRNRWKYIAELELDLDPDLPLVPVMLSAINQVTLNLVVNAADAIEEARRRFPGREGRIRISTRAQGGFAVIEVQDNGTGIPEPDRARVFEHFFTTKPVGAGTGLGLPICHAAVTKMHNGEITFRTALGEGTTFIVRLPLIAEPAVRERKEAA